MNASFTAEVGAGGMNFNTHRSTSSLISLLTLAATLRASLGAPVL
jgi:hypothetical protein